MRFNLCSYTALAVLFALQAPLQAQVAGRLSGSVVDASGAAVPSANIRLFLPGGNTAVLSTTTTDEGLFNIPTVRPEYYDLKIEASGFQTKTLARVKVDASRETAIPTITLDVSATAETIEVRESTTAVQTASAEIATTVTRAQIESLPMLDRQVTNLYLTQPGVVSSRTATTINGLRPSYSNLLLDGINVQDSVRINSLDYQPNRLTIGQIAEMTVSASNTNPTIGGNATTVSLSTPSGGNEYHGNAYWYNRNSFFGANDWFNNQSEVERPFLNLNQPGGTIGGPIIKDKLLFFTNYEAYRLKQQSPVSFTILTPEARQGIFRYRDTSTGEVRSFNVLQNQGLSVDPVIQNLLSQVPAAGNFTNLGDALNTTGYSFNARDNTTRDNFVTKLDYYLSTSNSFSGSYLWNRDITDRPDDSPFYTPVPPIYNDNKAHFMSASWRWNPAPALTNELRGGFNRPTGTFKRRTEQPAFFVDNTTLIFDSPVNESLPENRATNVYSIQDNANWIKGRHSLSFGFQATMWRVPATNYISTVPTYGIGLSNASPYGFEVGNIPGANAGDVSTANALLASLAGLVATGSQTFNITNPTSGFVPGAPSQYDISMNNYAPYFSDTWKVRRNLTLILGVRWEYFSPVNERNALALQPTNRSTNLLDALLGNPTLDFAGSSVGRPLYEKDLNNFAPNVGFAWDVFGNGRTAFRGGYAIAYANDNNINSVYNTFSVNQGLTSNISVANQAGRLTGSLPTIPTPQFQIPTTLQSQFDISPSNPPVQGIIDPKLRSPYVQQWNVSLEQELGGFTFAGRYIGNHTVGQYRQIDYNQVDVSRGGFLEDFKRARQNGFLALQAGGAFNATYNPNIAGSQPLPFFATLASGGALTNATVSGLIRRGEVGTLAQTYQTAGFIGDPNLSFFPNPRALYSSLLTNIAHSTYNSAQFEVSKRLQGGMQFQANYVFSKALSNASAFRSLEAQLDNNNPSLEKARAPYDVTHAFKVSHTVYLPFGQGRRFDLGNGFLDKVAGGWRLSGFLNIQSGAPVSILSNRGTLNRGARSINANTANVNVTGDVLRGATGLFKTGNGVYFVDPKHINTDGRGVAADGLAPFEGQLFFNPEPGSVGNLQRRYLTGPGYKNYDFSLAKETRLTERQSVEFRADFFNLFNHPNFEAYYDSANPDHDINNLNFGRITSQYYGANEVGPRVIQFGLFYRF